MKKSVFDYKSYKDYLTDLIAAQPKKGRGFRTALAEGVPCQIAYISQVLTGTRHFTLEQIEGINRFLGHNEDEGRFFLLLANFERAGTPALRTHYQKEMRRELDRHLNLKERFKAKEVLTGEAQAIYFGCWYHSAIHIALTIPTLRTKDALARAFNLPNGTVSKSLEFLTSVGLAEQNGIEYRPGNSGVYLGSASPLISQHHTNWRNRAIASLDPNNQDDLHYSAVVSIPREDFEKIKAFLAKTIEEARKHWVEAKREEQLCAIAFDWYRLTQQ